MVTLNQDIPQVQEGADAETAALQSQEAEENTSQINAEPAEEGKDAAADKPKPDKKSVKGWFRKYAVPIATFVSFASLLVTPLASIALISHTAIMGLKITFAWDMLAVATAVTAGFVARNFLAKKQSAQTREHQDNLIVKKIETVRDNVMDKVQDVVRNHEHVHVEEPDISKSMREKVLDKIKNVVLNREGTEEYAKPASQVHIHEYGVADGAEEYLKDLPRNEITLASEQVRTTGLDREMENHMQEHAPDVVAHTHAPMQQAQAAAKGAIDVDPNNAYYTVQAANHEPVVAVVKDKHASEQQLPSSPGKSAALVK